MFKYKTSKHLDRILIKLSKKDKKLYEQILKKISEVSASLPEHYKNLRHDLRDFKRVQIGHFVLVFRFDRKKELIYFADFDHHDNIYQKSSNHFFSLIEKEKNSS